MTQDGNAQTPRRPHRPPPTITVHEEPDAVLVHLDGKPLRTPEGQDLRLPNRALAEAVANELRADPLNVRRNPMAMPFLRLAATAIDRVRPAREATVEHLASYGATELLCYRAEHPAPLVARQHAVWQPLLDWAAARYGAHLAVVTGIMPQPQPSEALAALHNAVATYDDLSLTGLAMAVQTSGSLIVGLALAEARINAEEAFVIAELDESYEIEQWGEDAEATRRRERRRQDLGIAEAFLRLTHPI